MADRRRIAPPPGGTYAPVFTTSTLHGASRRTRPSSQPRKFFLQTGLVPSAAGSAYYEIQPSTSTTSSLISPTSNVKLTVTVHGPRPLPRNSAYSSTLVLNTHVKYAPFAGRVRRGWMRDSVERDLGAHLETALRGVILAERFPKSAVDVIVTVLEGEDEGHVTKGSVGGIGTMTVLAGAITASSAALVDAGIDCIDLVSGGVAALSGKEVLFDPSPSEHEGLDAACVVAYLQSRDEITELWTRGRLGADPEMLVDKAVEGAQLSRQVLAAVLREAVAEKLEQMEAGLNNLVDG